ncbi:MAG: DUF3047 domain-containing protein [Burkholderiales bacterium]|nr:DUF3047 domain-containing protein [Burkholderiales bacterium]
MGKTGRIIAAFALALAAGCASIPVEQPPETLVLPYVKSFSDNPPGEGVPGGWRPWALSRFKKPTQYRLVDDAGRIVVKASAQASASGLIHPLKLDPRQYPLLQWQWKTTALIATADNTQKHTEDSPVRVVVSFDGDIERLALDDRMFFDHIRLLTGQDLPYATLMYIWENRAPKDSVIPNRHTSRIRMIVAESGRDKVGHWQEVTRNVYEDYKRVFGEEPGRITSIGIMTDTDNTGENVHAYYGDILFRRIAPPRLTFATD